MVSKTFVVFSLLALVAVCYSTPLFNKRNEGLYQKNDYVDSNESQQSREPSDFNQKQQQKKHLQMQDSSSSESQENTHVKKMQPIIPQEEKNQSVEIRKAPVHKPMYQSRNGPEYSNGKQSRVNIQRSRNGEDRSNENSNEENNSRYDQNKIQRHQQY